MSNLLLQDQGVHHSCFLFCEHANSENLTANQPARLEPEADAETSELPAPSSTLSSGVQKGGGPGIHRSVHASDYLVTVFEPR